MKKRLLVLFMGILSLFMVGCTGTIVRPENTYLKKSSMAKVEVTGIRFNEATIEIENITDDFIEVVWDSTNINNQPIGFENQLIKDVRYKKSNTSIAPKNKEKFIVYIAKAIKYPAKLNLKLQQGQRYDYISTELKDTGMKTTIEYDIWDGKRLDNY